VRGCYAKSSNGRKFGITSSRGRGWCDFNLGYLLSWMTSEGLRHSSQQAKYIANQDSTDLVWFWLSRDLSRGGNWPWRFSALNQSNLAVIHQSAKPSSDCSSSVTSSVLSFVCHRAPLNTQENEITFVLNYKPRRARGLVRPYRLHCKINVGLYTSTIHVL
jgi:hypothetical protein